MTTKESSKLNTRRAIELAIVRLQEGKSKVVPPLGKINIASVAKEAGVSNATIHNRYGGEVRIKFTFPFNALNLEEVSRERESPK